MSGELIAAAIRQPASAGGTAPLERTIEARTPVPTNSASRPLTHASSIRSAPTGDAPSQFRAEQHDVTAAVVDHRRNELADKVLRTRPRPINDTGGADQHVDLTDQIVGGLQESIDRRRVGQVQISGEH